MKLFGLLFAFLCFVESIYCAQDSQTITTRDNISLKFLVLSNDNNLSKTAVIFFPGENGANMFLVNNDGDIKGRNFLVRTAKEFSNDFTTVLVDAPSDHDAGMSDEFRASQEHAYDIKKLIDYLVLQGNEKVYLVGTSRGTLSVASIASKIYDSHLKGIILTSTLEYRKLSNLTQLENIKLPVLMIHHINDGCKTCKFYEAKTTKDILSKNTSVDFEEISGGSLPASEPCEPLSEHGFYGVEDKVIFTIKNWINSSN